MKILRNLIVAAALLVIAAPAFAYFQPNVNLGFTSFLDGAPPAGPGHYVQEYLQYYTSDDLDGIPGGDVDVFVLMNQYTYQSNQELLFPDARWGINVMVPFVDIDSNLPNNGSGIGDLLIGPYLQWDPIMGKNGPFMLNRVELQLILPTGDYDNNKLLNQSSNHFSFNPYWAATIFPAPKVTASWRLHFLWNGENGDFGPGKADLEPGMALHGNWAVAYELMPKELRVGVNGYFFEQLTDTKINGNDSGDDESVVAIGPGAVYHFSKDMHLFANIYKEFRANDRPEGDRINFRFVYHF
ncbi:MAG: phenol degradation protein meta [Desulfuromonas sp.]|nr:MAG: phenol degradation protein meta [Desulfuromonas sp.]